MADHPAPLRKDECILEMQTLLETTGRLDNLSPFYKKYPEISRQTIWTWSRKIRDGEPTTEQVRAAYGALTKRIDAGICEDIPYVSPALVARGGEEALQQIDYAHQLRRLWADADFLREFAIKRNATDTDPDAFKIKNPVQFEKSMRVRMSLVETGLKIMEGVLDMRHLQAFYAAIVEEIGKESPEAQGRIMERLAVLNARRGMTMSMRI